MPRDSAAPCLSDRATGIALSVLSEITNLLEQLAKTGEPASIDLRSLPLSDVDREQLEEVLGHGEVMIELELAGKTEIWETTFPGVWWIRHRGAADKIATEEIAVCRVPEILMTHPVDIEAAAGRLRAELETT